MKLTAKTVDKLPAVEKPTTFFDSDLKGFGVRVMPPSGRSPVGARSWVVEYRPGAGGRAVAKRRLTLGAVTVLDASDARSQAKDVLARVRMGEDPAEQRSDERKSATVADLADRYRVEAGVGRKPRTKELYESYWRLWIIPAIGTMKARDVRRSDVARLHREVGHAHPATANRIVTLLAHFYAWAAHIEAVPEGANPAKGVERFRESARERYLSREELERLGRALQEAETIGILWTRSDSDTEWPKHAPRPENRRTRISPHATAAIRLLLLTGARLREILHLKWTEVDLERGLLLLPDSKTGRKTIVLGEAARDVIAGLDRIGPYVIAGKLSEAEDGTLVAKGPRADLQRPWALVSKRAGLDGVRLHDLRHTFASYGAAGGLGLPIIGGLLGHADAKTTQRYAHLGSDPLRRASDAISGRLWAALGSAEVKEAPDGAH